MATTALHDPIRVSPARSPSGTTWNVSIGEECQYVFTGERAKDRALASALRLAEDLRGRGPVLVLVEPPDRRLAA